MAESDEDKSTADEVANLARLDIIEMQMQASMLAMICVLKGIPGITGVDQSGVFAAIKVMTPLDAKEGFQNFANLVANDIFKKIGGVLPDDSSPS